MARIRTIKPQHVNDKALSTICLQAHLLWILLWPFSDDEGVFEADPLLIKSQLFPRRTDVRVEQIDQWLGQLTKARYIIPFTHNGEGYYIHRTFKTHQKIDRPQPSKIDSDIIRRILDEYSTNSSDTTALYSNVKDSSVKEGSMPTAVDLFPKIDKGKFPVLNRTDQVKLLWSDLKKLIEEKKSSESGLTTEELKNMYHGFIVEHKPDFLEPFAYVWNQFAIENGLNQMLQPTDDRLKKIRLRSMEPEFDFFKILQIIKRSSFLKGQTDGSNWKVDFDYVIHSKQNYVKILEGKFN